jgi:hypothetical protein
MQRGITADVAASQADVAAACRRAVDTLDGRGEFAPEGNKATVVITVATLGGKLIGSKGGRRTVIGISMTPSDDGKVHLHTNVESVFTTQETVLFIPIGPKRMWGRESFFKFLDALENELRAVDPNVELVRRQYAR